MNVRALGIGVAFLGVVLFLWIWRRDGSGVPTDRQFDRLGPHEASTQTQHPAEDLPALRQAVDRSPRDVRIIDDYVHAALSHAPEEAVRFLDDLNHRGPGRHYVLLHLSHAWLRQGDSTRALRYAAEAREVRDSPESNFALGVLWQMRAKPELAREAFRRSLQLNPKNPHAHEHMQALPSAESADATASRP